MKIIRTCLRILLALIYAVAIAVCSDLIAGIFFDGIPLKIYIAIFVVSFVVLLLCKPVYDRLWICIPLGFAAILAVTGAMYAFYYNGGYTVVDNGKTELYSGKNIMVLVPHQDDELLVAGGVIEEYIKYGSDVSFVFSTNGDANKPGETRLTEALSVAAALNVPEENVYFLGYGDRCIDGVHIYNSPDDALVPSQAGFTQTYALDSHPAVSPGNTYTKANLRSDLKTVISKEKPDIIYCVEVELHPDHSGLSLFLDEVMAELLKESSEYQPVILKSSCYATGFYAVDDFYGENIKATANPVGGENFANAYRWEDRIRLPINGSGLSRSIFGCDTFQHFSLHKSQYVQLKSEGAINGDKVFWLRDTGSLCYDAEITVSSGTVKFLNDFKLYDNYDVVGDFMNLGDNTWIPDDNDSEKTAHVELTESSYIQRICLYDDPSAENNVLNALITFDDGSSMETGKLNPNSYTSFVVDKDNVKSFSIKLLETEGESAGLTEIEAYPSQRDYGLGFIKLQNMQGDFVYDYYIDELGHEDFSIYAPGLDTEFRVNVDNPSCSVKYENGIVSVKCPANQSCTITISSQDGKYSDTVVISNPGRFMRETGPMLENLIRQFRRNNFQYCNSYQLIRGLYHLVF